VLLRERDDLIERRVGIAALLGVDVEVALVPAAVRLHHDRRERCLRRTGSDSTS